MRNLTEKQRGAAPIAIVLIVAVLVIAGAIGWFVFARGEDGENRAATGESTDTSAAGDANEMAFSGTYLDALERGDPLQCQWRLPGELNDGFQLGYGRLYTDGQSRGYTEATFEIEGQTTTGYAVIDPDYIYSWMDVPGMGVSGVRIPAPQAETEFEGLPATEQQQALDFRAEYSFDCQPWTVDSTLLTPPADITFTEINP